MSSQSTAQKVVLAYSGGLDTTCILFWLKEQGYDVICYLANVGQEEDFEAVRKQAISLGAIKAIVEDRQKEFVDQFIFPALSFGTIYQERYLLGTSLARPSIVKGLVETAKREGAHYISHGATGKGNDQVRFELGCVSLYPEIKVIAPWRLPEFYERFAGRKDLIEYAKQKGFTITATAEKPYSIDANLMHISYESGVLEDPMNCPPTSMFAWTKSLDVRLQEFEQTLKSQPGNAQQLVQELVQNIQPSRLLLHFKAGVPVRLVIENNGVQYTDSLQILKVLNKIGAEHGVGRIDIVEDRFIGMKSRGVYETPGATIVYQAVRDLETLCLDKEVNKIRQQLALQFAEKVYNGMWFSPEAQYLKHCLQSAQQTVAGVVRLQVFAGSITILGRKAEKSLYDQELVSMDVQGSFTPKDTEGFIRTQAIRLMGYNAVYAKNPFTGNDWSSD